MNEKVTTNVAIFLGLMVWVFAFGIFSMFLYFLMWTFSYEDAFSLKISMGVMIVWILVVRLFKMAGGRKV